MEQSRINFVKASLKKSKANSNDPFIRFIILWIGLNSLYSQKKWEVNGRNYGEKVVKNFFKEKQTTIYNTISSCRDKLKALFQFISTEEQHENLSNYVKTRKDFLKKQPSNRERAVETFAEVLVKIRNNMFHAVKLWEDTKEEQLLDRVSPILEDLLKRLINYSIT